MIQRSHEVSGTPRTVLSLVLATAVVAAVTLARPVPAAAQVEVRTVAVRGEGEMRTSPDRAVLWAAVQVEGATLPEAKEGHDAAMRRVLAFMTDSKIKSEDIESARISLQPRYEYDQGRRVPYGYEAVQTLRITVRDLAVWEDLLSGLLEAGINRLDNVVFESSRIEALAEEVRTLALRDARTKAEAMAAVYGEGLRRVLHIEEEGAESPQPMPYQARAMALEGAGGGGPVAAPGEIVVRASVRVVFELAGG